MEKNMEKNESISRDLSKLKKRVARLHKIPLKKLNDAVCDIIDLKGYGLAVLLHRLPDFSEERQLKIVQKIEDFLYFHPEKGVRVFNRLKKACAGVSENCRPHLLACMVDVSEKMLDADSELIGLLKEAEDVLNSPVDFVRKGKAIEIIGRSENKKYLPAIIKNMIDASVKVGEFANYHFIENCLLVLKRLGGDSLLRLIINPNSDNAIKQLRLEWRSEKAATVSEMLRITQLLDTDFAQALLRVVDFSDFNLPFASMIQEGMSHQDKWVRQSAVASMAKASEALSPEVLARMLNDSSPEVRLMAVTSMGGYSIEQTGDILESLASNDGETIGTRMNALYALYSQKNLPVLERCATLTNPKIALNSIGLSSLLRPKFEGLDSLMRVFAGVKSERAAELEYYLLEMLEPEDLKRLVDFHRESEGGLVKENCLNLLKSFLQKNSGPRLDRAKAVLSEGEIKALNLLNVVGDPDASLI